MGYIDFKKIVNDLGKSQEELDIELWKDTEYEGMKFKRKESWDIDSDFAYEYTKYASPKFEFENGDVVVIDKFGNIKKLN